MSVTIRIDNSRALAGLSAVELKQIPFATAKAVTQTGLDFQKAERARLAQIFTLRRADFIQKQGVKLIGGIATKQKPSITFGVDPKANFLDKFETGATKSPTQGASLAIPVDAKRNKRDIITPANRPRQLLNRLKDRPGAGGAFILRTAHGKLKPGVYLRTGRGGRNASLLFALTPQAKTPNTLDFLGTFQQTVHDRWQSNFHQAFIDALATAK